jgi:hypothetical protein
VKISLIPWHVFIEALKKQQPALLELWLSRWLFTNDGVLISRARR